MVWQFIKELFIGVFWSYRSITSWLGFMVFVLWLLLPKLKWEGKMKKGLETVSWPYRFLIILGLIFISVILTSYSLYNDKQQQINILQKTIDSMKQIDNPKRTAAPISSSKKRSARPYQSLSKPKLLTQGLIAVEVNEPNK